VEDIEYGVVHISVVPAEARPRWRKTAVIARPAGPWQSPQRGDRFAAPAL